MLADAVQPWMHLLKLDHLEFTIVFLLFFGFTVCLPRRPKTYNLFLCYICLHFLCHGGDSCPHRIYLWALSLQQHVGAETRLSADDHPAGMVHDDPSWRVAGVLARAIDSVTSRTFDASSYRGNGDDSMGHGDVSGEYGGWPVGMGARRNIGR
jgi:hypothetical protein